MPLTFSKLPGYAIEGESITLDQTSDDVDAAIGSGIPKIVSLSYPNGNTSTRADAFETLTLSGSGFGANANAWIGSVLSSNTTVINSNSITFVCPVVSVGNNTVYVVNTDGGTGSFSPGVQATVAAGFQGVNYGYTSGGAWQTPPDNIIDKFPLATDANATDVGNLTEVKQHLAGQSSYTHGYTSGGSLYPATTITQKIDKFSFASDGNATDVGDLSVSRYLSTGQSSDVSGYTSGGFAPPPNFLVNTIDKFSFASDGNASDVGDLTGAKNGTIGQSSTSSGYVSGYGTGIEKFSFASDSNGTSVGNLTAQPNGGAGQQV